MSRSRLLAIAVLCSVAFAPVMALAQGGDNMIIEQRPITLLQPFSDQTTLEPSSGIEIFFEYFNTVWPFLLGSAAGFAVLRVLVAGIKIMVSKGGSQYEEGKEQLMWAIAGLVMLILAGFILRTINPLFYQ